MSEEKLEEEINNIVRTVSRRKWWIFIGAVAVSLCVFALGSFGFGKTDNSVYESEGIVEVGLIAGTQVGDKADLVEFLRAGNEVASGSRDGFGHFSFTSLGFENVEIRRHESVGSWYFVRHKGESAQDSADRLRLTLQYIVDYQRSKFSNLLEKLNENIRLAKASAIIPIEYYQHTPPRIVSEATFLDPGRLGGGRGMPLIKKTIVSFFVSLFLLTFLALFFDSLSQFTGRANTRD